MVLERKDIVIKVYFDKCSKVLRAVDLEHSVNFYRTSNIIIKHIHKIKNYPITEQKTFERIFEVLDG